MAWLLEDGTVLVPERLEGPGLIGDTWRRLTPDEPGYDRALANAHPRRAPIVRELSDAEADALEKTSD